jgi:excisionase family DNA binding protein
MNATAARDDVDLADLGERVSRLERDLGLALALVHIVGDRVAELEGAPAPDKEQVTTIKGAAYMTGFSETTIRKRIAKGAIEARHVGGRWLIKTASLAARSKG